MPQFERRLYEPDELRVYDGSEDEMEDEGSRLPLLIVIALVVLASFAGVVWLAYTQGVQRGREDTPRVVAQQNKAAAVAPKNPYSDLQIYRSPKGNSGANNESTTPAEASPPPQAVLPERPNSKPAVMPSANASIPKPKPEILAKPTIVKPHATALGIVTPKGSSPAATGAPRVITPPAPKIPPRTNAQSSASNDTAMIDKVLAAQRSPAAQSAQAAQHGGGYVLQIGSYTSQAEANASWQTYKAAHSSVAGYAPDVAQADLGSKGTWYRLRVGPFATLSEASAACARLKAQGGKCFPAKQ
jgi:cell division septation protein DedD